MHTIDLYEDLIQMPLPLSMLAYVGDALRSNLACEDWTKPVDPKPHTLMAEIDPSLMEEVFDIPQRQRKPNIHHHRELYDLWRCLEIAEWVLVYRIRLKLISYIKMTKFR
ncbi:MAG: hypothetical protein Hens3KO_08960 [Henriciella sp.]